MKKKIFLWIRFCALLSALCMAIVAISFAWFNQDTHADIDSWNANAVDQVFALRAAYSGSEEWFAGNLKIPVTKEDNSKVVFKPVTGDGENFFSQKFVLKPIENTNYSVSVQDGYQSVDSSAVGKDYLVLDYKLKHDDAADLILESTSSVRPASESKKDVVASCAVRLCISKKNKDNYDPVLIWIPNIEGKYKENGGEKSIPQNTSATFFSSLMTGVENGENEDQPKDPLTVYFTKTGKEGGELLPNGMYKDNNTGVCYLWGDIGKIDGYKEAVLATTKAETPVEFRLTMWIDGEDEECNKENDAIGGEMMVSLVFGAITES